LFLSKLKPGSKGHFKLNTIYVYQDGDYLTRNWGSYKKVAILVAIMVNERGEQNVIGAEEGICENKANRLSFISDLKKRGLYSTQRFFGEK